MLSRTSSVCVESALHIYECLDYEAAWALQHSVVEQRIADRCIDTLLLTEHQPVFTIGRSGKEEHWDYDSSRLTDAGYPVYHVERGGSVTYHGPGQLVGYPILRLATFCPGPKFYVRLLEEVLIRTLKEWGIDGRRIEPWPGIWVGREGPAKIAAIGVKVQRGVTMHGFALNVNMDLSPFRLITPCGIQGSRVSSMVEELNQPIDVQVVRHRLADLFADCFNIRWIEQKKMQALASRLINGVPE